MTEIKIEKKKPLWPRILAGIILIAALVYFLGNRKGDETDVAQTVTDTAAAPKDRAVNEYINYVNEGRTMGLDHVYTNGALMRLTNALSAKANEIGFDITADLDKVKEQADHITQDPFETTHAKSIRSAADILSNAMKNMQQAKYPDLRNQLEEVRDAANNIQPNVLRVC